MAAWEEIAWEEKNVVYYYPPRVPFVPNRHKPPHPVYVEGVTILGKTKYGIPVNEWQFRDNHFNRNGLDGEDFTNENWWHQVHLADEIRLLELYQRANDPSSKALSNSEAEELQYFLACNPDISSNGRRRSGTASTAELLEYSSWYTSNLAMLTTSSSSASLPRSDSPTLASPLSPLISSDFIPLSPFFTPTFTSDPGTPSSSLNIMLSDDMSIITEPFPSFDDALAWELLREEQLLNPSNSAQKRIKAKLQKVYQKIKKVINNHRARFFNKSKITTQHTSKSTPHNLSEPSPCTNDNSCNIHTSPARSAAKEEEKDTRGSLLTRFRKRFSPKSRSGKTGGN
ncbi:hypothetical protein G7Y89_g8587 [Cudoniella acicularis]|uniref:Uncharacterized protein n=1 Tax=Cudoniella acicularis TaxID=354080 RepID=A0A8H4RK02_9HELO|nr:hypothetical protein G7Y89_g8587 [Cudoniella acicularis]